MERRGRNERVDKTLQQKVLDLDAHLYLLRKHLEGLRDSSAAHIKGIAAELRVLLCRSSGVEGLLYRLVEELAVNDSINLHVPGELIPDHPHCQGLQFLFVPIWRGGQGPEQIPAYDYSFLKIIRHSQALVATGKPLTHEYLIKAVAQQMGSAHEDEGVEPALAQLLETFINGVQPFYDVLIMDAKLTLEVGERVLSEAKKRNLQWRSFHGHEYGNVTVGIRIAVKQRPASPVQLCRFLNHGPITIKCFLTGAGVEFWLEENQSIIAKIPVPYPDDFQFGKAMVFALSYCSQRSEAYTITAQGASKAFHCKLGWLHAIDLDYFCEEAEEVTERGIFGYWRLLTRDDIAGLQALWPFAEMKEGREADA